MLARTELPRASLSRLNHEDEREFHLMVWVTFLFFLPIAVASRLLPRALKPFDRAGRGSARREAWEAANIAMSYAFMR